MDMLYCSLLFSFFLFGRLRRFINLYNSTKRGIMGSGFWDFCPNVSIFIPWDSQIMRTKLGVGLFLTAHGYMGFGRSRMWWMVLLSMALMGGNSWWLDSTHMNGEVGRTMRGNWYNGWNSVDTRSEISVLWHNHNWFHIISNEAGKGSEWLF